jgi:hypothetical protein
MNKKMMVEDLVKLKEAVATNWGHKALVAKVSGWVLPEPAFTKIEEVNFSLDCDTPQEATINKMSKKKKGNTMCYDCDGGYGRATVEEQRIQHLRDRLSIVNYEKDRKLMKAYGLMDDDIPATLDEMIERLTSGKFVVPEDKKKRVSYLTNIVSWIEWRDPEVKRDKEGYKEASEKLSKAFNETLDTIVISDPKAGLEALQAFENTEFK